MKKGASHRRDSRLTAISFVADAANRTLELREIAENALHAILAVTQLDAGLMYRWTAGEGALRLFAARGLPDEFTRRAAVIRRGADSVIDEVLAGQARRLGDFRLRGRAGRRDKAGFREALLCPIRTQGRMVGLLVLGAYRSRRLGPDATELIEVIANQIGIAIAKAELVDDLARKNQLLELLVEEAHHRIKNNLQMISGLLQLSVGKHARSSAGAAVCRAMSQIQAIAQVHNLLSEEMPEWVAVDSLVTAVLNTLRATVPQHRRAALQVAVRPFRLNADQAVAVALIVNELTANALRHGRPRRGEPLRVTVECRQRRRRVRLTVADNGGGLPVGAPAATATGQGMNIVRQLVQVNLRGRLAVVNHGGGVRAEVEFDAPAAPSVGAA